MHQRNLLIQSELRDKSVRSLIRGLRLVHPGARDLGPRRLERILGAQRDRASKQGNDGYTAVHCMQFYHPGQEKCGEIDFSCGDCIQLDRMRSAVANSDTQTERLVFALRERILRGEFNAGERLTELGLVSLLQASRTPIRLALERLAHEGLVHALASGGFRVRSFSVGEIWDAIEIRGVLEGTAARFAAERLEDQDELASLRTLLAEETGESLATVEAFARYAEVNDRFHRELWRLSKSSSLMRTLEAACKTPFVAPGALVFRDGMPAWSNWASIAAEHHRALVEAISDREGARAEALAREHSRVARRNLEFALRNEDLIRSLPGASLIETE